MNDDLMTAHHWSTESIYSHDVAVAIFDESVYVGVRTEVPQDAHDQPVRRFGNRWWPTLVTVEMNGADVTMFPEEALALAKALAEAAHMAETADEPDTEAFCGHWAPCDCGRPKVKP